jgi:Co/Zn/Cd efflux system component
MFATEAAIGWWAESAGLLADSLDMLADAFVYGIALYAVGRSVRHQANAATAAGVMQMALGLGVAFEVIRRFLFPSEPVSIAMMAVGMLALVANVWCLWLISKHRDSGVHMRASWIFSANDVIANLGVIVAGALVLHFDSRVPDLVIGAIISTVVLSGGVRILRDASAERRGQTSAQ